LLFVLHVLLGVFTVDLQIFKLLLLEGLLDLVGLDVARGVLLLDLKPTHLYLLVLPLHCAIHLVVRLVEHFLKFLLFGQTAHSRASVLAHVAAEVGGRPGEAL